MSGNWEEKSRVWKVVGFGRVEVWELELTMRDVEGEACTKVVVGDLGDLGGFSLMKTRVSDVRSSVNQIVVSECNE